MSVIVVRTSMAAMGESPGKAGAFHSDDQPE
jgi:hypothetical protein